MGDLGPELFNPLISRWFAHRYGQATDAQTQAWPLIRNGEHVLVSAPTGSGKTLTAFLIAINDLVCARWAGSGVRVVYVSPLKALNNDIQRNLLTPLAELESWWRVHAPENSPPFPHISVMTRSGDTNPEQRRKMIRQPPDILITTPESLNLLLTSRSGRGLLGTIRILILDEIHALAGNKRGAHLITAVERLTLDAGEFQRIGLSATVKPLETVAQWLGGFCPTASGLQPRPVHIVRSADRRDIELVMRTIEVDPSAPKNVGPSGPGGQEKDAWWDALSATLVKIIQANKSTLVFTNSRRMAEKITRNINESAGEILAYSHHGSLSKELRLSVEERLKAGELRAIVATSSLELGIDIGALDRVIMIQSPLSVSAALQRIGRSGHQVGGTSVSDLIPLHGMDTIYSAVLGTLVNGRQIEDIAPIQNPLDILAQVVLSMTCREEWHIDALFDFIRQCWPYRNLSRRYFDLTIDMLAGRFSDAPIRDLKPRLVVDVLAGTIRAREGSDFLLYQSGGTIPDRGYYHLRVAGDKSLVGELDEEFVWERNLGDQFTFGTTAWQITAITQSDVEVIPADPSRSMIPFWKGEDLNRDFHLSEQVALFLEQADTRLDDPGCSVWLQHDYQLDASGAESVIRFLRLQREMTTVGLPGRHHVVVEEVQRGRNRSAATAQERPDVTQIIIHTFWGGRLNKPFALALTAAWEEQFGVNLEFFAGNECILLELPTESNDSEGHQWSPKELVTGLVSSRNLEGLLRRKLERTGLFGAHFRENAARALLLPKGDVRRRFPLWLNRLRSKKLLDAVIAYPDFPLVVETWRECLEDEFDIENLHLVLDELASGTIAVSACVSRQTSPFAEGLVWKQTNQYMYQDDTPSPSQISGLSADLFKQLISEARLRPALPMALAEELTAKLQSTWLGYRPGNPGDLVNILNEQGFMSAKLWDELCRFSASEASIDPYFERDLSALSRLFVRFRPPAALNDWIVALPQLKGILTGLGLSLANPPADLPTRVRDWLKSAEIGEVVTPSDILYEEAPFPGEVPPEASISSGLAREGLLLRWMARQGPVSLQSLADMFGWDANICLPLIETLVESGKLVSGYLIEGNAELLFCDTDNYERLLRMFRQSLRPLFTAWKREELDLFLARWQGVVEPSNSIEHLKDHLDRLFTYPLNASAWEKVILPVRLPGYQSAWMDSLFANYGLAWFGCGDGRLAFTFIEELSRFRLEGSEMTEEADRGVIDAIPEADAPFHPRANLLEIAHHTGITTAQMTETLWRSAWKGLVSVDSFEAVRRGIRSDFKPDPLDGSGVSKRGGYKRWEQSRPLIGGWFRIPRRPDIDAVDRLEQSRENVMQLLKRYGILFREILQQELPQFRWSQVFRTLRLMELSGEVHAGRFFEGIPGIQFASPEAWRRMQQTSDIERQDESTIWWINAVDPASLCGMVLDVTTAEIVTGLALPRRVATNWLVYLGKRLVMVVHRNGKELDLALEPGDGALGRVLNFFPFLLGRSVDPPSSITIETINGSIASSSPWLPDFKRVGFISDYRNLTLWKRF